MIAIAVKKVTYRLMKVFFDELIDMGISHLGCW